MIDRVLEFWFEPPSTTAEAYGRKLRRWFMGGPSLDAEIRDKFGALVERALAGELDGWSATPRGRLALILLLDQFTRSIFRDTPRMYAGDPRAQILAAEACDRGLDRAMSIEERQFLTMPFLHAEDLALQDRSVVVTDALHAEAPAWQQELLQMGIEQSRKYRDVIARFGRFPHRNKLLGRTNTPDEEAFLVDWHAKMPPSGAAKLPS